MKVKRKLNMMKNFIYILLLFKLALFNIKHFNNTSNIEDTVIIPDNLKYNYTYNCRYVIYSYNDIEVNDAKELSKHLVSRISDNDLTMLDTNEQGTIFITIYLSNKNISTSVFIRHINLLEIRKNVAIHLSYFDINYSDIQIVEIVIINRLVM